MLILTFAVKIYKAVFWHVKCSILILKFHVTNFPFSLAYQCRVAEEVIFGEDNVTTGASNDFMQVSRVARQMVERFGFSKRIGQVAIGGPGGNPFLGQQVGCEEYRFRFLFHAMFSNLGHQ